jgi:hypothetical protein
MYYKYSNNLFNNIYLKVHGKYVGKNDLIFKGKKRIEYSNAEGKTIILTDYDIKILKYEFGKLQKYSINFELPKNNCHIMVFETDGSFKTYTVYLDYRRLILSGSWLDSQYNVMNDTTSTCFNISHDLYIYFDNLNKK